MTPPDIPIPPEAIEAARAAWLESASDYTRLDVSIEAACRAMLAAWPGMHNSAWSGPAPMNIILPLHQEPHE